MKIENLRYILLDGREISFEDWTHESKFGIKWEFEGDIYVFNFGYCVDAEPTPLMDGVVLIYPDFHKTPEYFKYPHNAAIYNADGSLRFRLHAPKPLSRYFPGYMHTIEEVAKIEPEGFWQVGWGSGDGIANFDRPWMWVHVGLYYDVYERRYFDPSTGQFDMNHFHTARR